jgi:hypothetical protein
MTHVEYRTPVGMVSVRHGQTVEMRRAGASISWVKEHAIKGPEDYKVLAHIFGNLKITPAYERYNAWRDGIGEDGIAVAHGLGLSCISCRRPSSTPPTSTSTTTTTRARWRRCWRP